MANADFLRLRRNANGSKIGLEQLSIQDRDIVKRARRLERFFTQPFFTTAQFSTAQGKFVTLEQSLDGCERILSGEFNHYPEQSLYMIGSINEIKLGDDKVNKDKQLVSDGVQ